LVPSKKDITSIIAIPKNTKMAPYLVNPIKKLFAISVNKLIVAFGGKTESADITTLLVKKLVDILEFAITKPATEGRSPPIINAYPVHNFREINFELVKRSNKIQTNKIKPDI